ncbi:hypothetical protein M422DRAFT_258680 [Sphaerobolus stellatus SS14]|uniref:Uncharacterized protein n=1 Tax=Sphaerobolus stellatus (strain SS14) TaxID=990650 RepID=A0A0C9VL85_SPHS4|nr:hypothetical protein M422DRAFT_258680 [Sphaerobolus stellatus SS14]
MLRWERNDQNSHAPLIMERSSQNGNSNCQSAWRKRRPLPNRFKLSWPPSASSIHPSTHRYWAPDSKGHYSIGPFSSPPLYAVSVRPNIPPPLSSPWYESSSSPIDARHPSAAAPFPTVPLNPDSMFRISSPNPNLTSNEKSRTLTLPPPQQASSLPRASLHKPSSLIVAVSAMPYRPLSIASKPLASRKALPTPVVSLNIPVIDSLCLAQRTLPNPHNPSWLPWIRDVVFLIERYSVPSQSQPGTVEISHPILRALTASAASALIRILSSTPPHLPETMYLHSLLPANGAVNELIPFSRRDTYKDWENARTRGWNKVWLRLGRDYESVENFSRARDCFERGLRAGVESCIYPIKALPLLQEGANLRSIETPHPAYVFVLLLRGEFAEVKVEEQFLAPFIPEGSTSKDVARSHLERAAYCGFIAAQYKVGLVLVRQEGPFDEDEEPAVRFADQAARKGLLTGGFAMGYYAEISIRMSKNIETAREWDTKAAANGNIHLGFGRLRIYNHDFGKLALTGSGVPSFVRERKWALPQTCYEANGAANAHSCDGETNASWRP